MHQIARPRDWPTCAPARSPVARRSRGGTSRQALAGRRHSPARRLSGTRHRRCVVLWHAPAVGVHVAEIELGLGLTLFGSFSIPRRRCRVVLWHAQTLAVLDAGVVLGFSKAFIDKRTPQTQSRRVVASLVGCVPILKRS